MIVDGPAVLVGSELARVVLAALVDAVRRDPSSDSTSIRRLVAELEEISASARTSVASVPLTGEGGRWLDTAEAAAALGVTERTIRRRAAAGQIRAEREDGRWRVAI